MRKICTLLLAGVVAASLAGLAGGTTSAAKLKVRPVFIVRGGTLTISGTGFRPSMKVTLRIGRPDSANLSRVGSVKAKASGRFAFSKTISRSTEAGLWIVRACQANCRTKATALFRVAKIKPV
jgi:hypothetical protein